MKKTTLLAYALPVCLITILLYVYFTNNDTVVAKDGSRSEQKLRYIREAFKQEFKKTKDPFTNTVPRERLLQAAAEVKDFLEQPDNLAIPGISWVERGPSNVAGRTRALIFDRADITNNTLFAGGVSGGLWKCTNLSGSPVWTKLNDVLDNVAISCIIQDPVTTSVLYAGTGETWGNIDALRGLGIYKSLDGGLSWNLLPSTNNPGFYYTQKIVISAAGNIFAATSDGVKKSTNGGISWSTVLAGDFSDIAIASNNDLYAANFFGRVYKSLAASGGNTWTNISPSGAFATIKIGIAPSDNQKIYLLCEGPTSGNCDAIFRSDNGGASWIPCTVPTIIDQGNNSNFTRQQAWYDLVVSVDPNDASAVVIGGVDALRSVNGGLTWNQITTWSLFAAPTFTQTVHADHHAAVFAPGSSSRLVWGTDGGVYFTDNVNVAVGKPTVASKNTGYNVTQFYCGAIHPTAGTNYFLAGSQDNGSQRFNGAGIVSTTEVSGGDGAFCHIDQTNANFQITSYVYCNFYRSTNGGTSFSAVVNDDNGAFINPTDYDDAADILFAGYAAGQYLRWPISGMMTKDITVTNFNSSTVSHVYVSPNTADRVYFGLDNGSVVYVDGASTGNGANITKAGVVIKTGVGSVSGIAIEPGNENHILVSYSNYGVTSVFETTNGGSAWTSIEGNLPDMPVRWVIFNPANSTQALLATELGVWTTNAINGTNTDWTPTNGGLANTRVDVLQVRTSDNTILAATHGRGVFTTTLTNTVLPTTYFKSPKADNTELGNVATTCGLNYRDIPVTMMISNAAGSDVTATITVDGSSTATLGQDFSLSANSVTFGAGVTTPQVFNIRVYNDHNFEGRESIILNYSITAGGAAATKGTTFQTYQLDIIDDETAPTASYTAQYATGPYTTNLGASSPIQSTQSDKKSQYLYLASELLSNGLKAGDITAFNFSVNSKASTLPYMGFTISIAPTSVANLAAGFVSPVPSFTTIYTAPVGGYTPLMGENEFPITGFTWDGTSNILMQFCYNNATNGAANTDDILVGQETGYVSQAKNASTTTSSAGCSFTTSTVTNVFRPVLLFSQPIAATGIATVLNTTKQAYIGPYETVHFFDASGNIIATVKNLDNFDYGCTSVEIDRAGTSALPFWNNTISNYLASKTVRFIPANNNTNGNLQFTLYYTAAEKAGWESVTNQFWSNVGMVKVKNAAISDVTPSNPMITSVALGNVTDRSNLGPNYTVTASFNTGFSGLGVGVPAAPVPVTWLSFSGRILNGHSELNWSTGSEFNSRDFTVEKSDNGLFFHSIGSVSAGGNSTTVRQYQFTDPAKVADVQFYRIRQNDINGNYNHSPVIRLQHKSGNITIGPNPFRNHVTISFNESVSGVATALFYDGRGRQVISTKAYVAGSTWSIYTGNVRLAAGNYTLRVLANGREYAYIILKE